MLDLAVPERFLCVLIPSMLFLMKRLSANLSSYIVIQQSEILSLMQAITVNTAICINLGTPFASSLAHEIIPFLLMYLG